MEGESLTSAIKVAVVGDSTVGKTSVIRRYHSKEYSESQQPTVGAAFYTQKAVYIDEEYTLHIWDTAGQEVYKSLVPMYLRGSNAVLVLFDLSKPETFDHVDGWITSIRKEAGEDPLIYVAGNKSDLGTPSNEEAIKKWQETHRKEIIMVSAKTGENVDLLFSMVTEGALTRYSKERVICVTPKNKSQTGEKEGCC